MGLDCGDLSHTGQGRKYFSTTVHELWPSPCCIFNCVLSLLYTPSPDSTLFPVFSLIEMLFPFSQCCNWYLRSQIPTGKTLFFLGLLGDLFPECYTQLSMLLCSFCSCIHVCVCEPYGTRHSLDSIFLSIVYSSIWLTMTVMSCNYLPCPTQFACLPFLLLNFPRGKVIMWQHRKKDALCVRWFEGCVVPLTTRGCCD